jgi:pimeloyl-ACP methyl ester carboxylesterase
MYTRMRQASVSLTARAVKVVKLQPYDWITSITRMGWVHLLNKLERGVREAIQLSSTGKVILIGHSQGGVLARLYLSPEPFLGRRYRGLDCVTHLITLGSPHINYGGLTRGQHMSAWVERHYPGAAFAPQVGYTSVAGKYERGDLNGSARERWLFENYQRICGDGSVWGDGIVPLPSALLPGSRQIVLEGVCHYSPLSEPWYGSPEVLPLWWNL